MMMKKSFLFSLLSLLFLFCNQISIPVHAKPVLKYQNKNEIENETRHLRAKRQLDSGEIVCVDLADFFYEIVLSVTSFPEQGTCSNQEEAEIAALLQKIINTELRAIPGTINTKNKVCSDPINNRRLLLGGDSFDRSLFNHNEKQQQEYAETANYTDIISDQDERSLSHNRHRSFIYVGGGRCRYCFYDDNDQRLLASSSSTTTAMNGLPTKLSTNKFGIMDKHARRRNLLFYMTKKPDTPYPTVADISLCRKFIILATFYLGRGKNYKAIKWINGRFIKSHSEIQWKCKYNRNLTLVGPYAPGESFAAQMDMNVDFAFRNKYLKTHGQTNNTVNLPIKEGTIHFKLAAFDLPDDISTEEFWADDPLIIFINGIKLDFKLLLSQPGVQKKSGERRGSSLAGIKWRITHSTSDITAFGPQKDWHYGFQITAPMVVLSHKNQFDLDFIIKPNAKAKQYAMRDLHVDFKAAQCEVTDLENSPFEDFQSVVESRLFHKLGMEMAREFQGKQGHCLFDKIPVVGVHLVEKESWKESSPQCAR